MNFTKRLSRFWHGLKRPQGTYFISHSYSDKEAVERLKRWLPFGMKPFIFPYIDVEVDDSLSRHLTLAIQDCDGLIYLLGGNSEKSIWVDFERRYALSINKPVFAANPTTAWLKRVWGIERNKRWASIFTTHSRKDFEIASKVKDALRQVLVTDLIDTVDEARSKGDDYQKKLKRGIEKAIAQEGFQLVFWSANAATSHWVEKEIQSACRVVSIDGQPRTVFLLLDDTPLPDYLTPEQCRYAARLEFETGSENISMKTIERLIFYFSWYYHPQSLAGDGSIK